MLVRTARSGGWLLAVVLAWGRYAAAQDAGELSCTSSLDCAPPTPYCQASTNVCVPCLGDRNCPSGKVCEVTTGACVGCRTSNDCFGFTPYCDTTDSNCVECLTSSQCGTLGLECRDGQCGSCGDGICGPRERVYVETDPWLESALTQCHEDCGGSCPSNDIGSSLGTFTASPAENLFELSWCSGTEAPDVSFAWRAPYDGKFLVTTPGGITVLEGTCEDAIGFECYSGAGSLVEARQGEQFLFVVDDEGVSSLTVSAESRAPVLCDEGMCPDGGDPRQALCLANATDRGEPVCAGAQCACENCPQDYDDCSVIPGCPDVLACMVEHDCVGRECYDSGACHNVIAAHQGVTGPAFRASTALRECSVASGCALPCPAVDAGLIDAGPGPAFPDASPDAAVRVCTPGEEQPCACDGGTSGTRVCRTTGDGFEPCACSTAPTSPVSEDSGCACRGARRSPTNTSLAGPLAAFAAIGLGALRRRRREVRC